MQLLVSATRKSSGKTVVCIGLCAEWRARGMALRAFKKGPDYIDPQWLAHASGRACYNLDFHVQSHDEIRALVAARAPGAPGTPGTPGARGQSLSLIEANKGLFDGVAADGGDSNAALARLLGAPVVLVVDCEGMTRGIAPLLQGYVGFDDAVTIAGVILNRVGGERHRAKLAAAIRNYTDVPVLGAIMNDARLRLPERHLGLTPFAETEDAARKIEQIREAVAAQVDVDLLTRAARVPTAGPATVPNAVPNADPTTTAAGDVAAVRGGLKLAVFKDRAFAFYYPDDLEDFERRGVELAFVDGLHDARLPRADGLFIGGGFPETQAAALTANDALRHDVARAIQGGLPAYAECGGLMYLARGITWHGQRYEMCGVVEADVLMCDTPRGRGYVEFSETVHMPWPASAPRLERAHEFHYSRLVNAAPFDAAYALSRGVGTGDGRDGIVHKNLLASYLHRRAVGTAPWTERFIQFIQATREDQGRPATSARERPHGVPDQILPPSPSGREV